MIPPVKSPSGPRRSWLAAASKSSRGFTLVEVVLALGIVAFAFVTTLGMLPVGLDVSQRASETTVVAHIYQQMSSHALQTDFSKLSGLSAAPAYYDQQGKTVSAGNSLYKAKYVINTSTMLPAAQPTDKLATVSIYILATRGQKVAASDPATDPKAQKFNVLISDNGI